jgi:hypothetical protein
MSAHGSVPRGLVARQLTQLTLDECAAAVGVAGLSPGLRRLAVSPFVPLARRLGEEIGAFDAGASVSLEQSARALLTRLHVPIRAEFAEPLPTNGPLLVIANHPGVYDALLLFATLPRADLRLIAADRSFLRSLPSVGRHLVYVPECPATALSLGARGRGLRQVVRHLKGGGAVLHFAAGQIEPDPAFSKDDCCLGAWPSGAAALAAACIRLGGRVVLALVSGVHSPRVKQSALIRFAEARGITTLSALVQIALPRFFTVSPSIRYSAPLPLERGDTPTTEHLQHVLRRLGH